MLFVSLVVRVFGIIGDDQPGIRTAAKCAFTRTNYYHPVYMLLVWRISFFLSNAIIF